MACDCPVARHEHGTERMYQLHLCGCDPCRAAHVVAQRRKVTAGLSRVYAGAPTWLDSTGTRRRLEGLQASGWSQSQIAEQLGVVNTSVSLWLRRPTTKVTPDFAARVAYLYDRCWHLTPPGRGAVRAARHAARLGYVEAWRWDGVDIDDPTAVAYLGDAQTDAKTIDEIAVDLACGGYRVKLTNAEYAAAVAKLAGRGLSDRGIGERLGRNVSAICNLRRRHGIPAGSLDVLPIAA